MNEKIKKEIEEYVLGEFKYLADLDSSDENYGNVKSDSIKDINTLMIILQKDDDTLNNLKINSEKIELEAVKIERDHDINLKKIDVEIRKNENSLDLEYRKIDVGVNKNESDAELKKQELNINSKKDAEIRNDRIIKIIIDGVTIIAPIVLYNIWMKRGFEFEQTGTYCSTTFKNLIGKFKPCK